MEYMVGIMIALQELAKCLKDEAGVKIKGWY